MPSHTREVHTHSSEPALTLSELLTAMGRSWRVLVAGAGLGLLAGAAVGAAIPAHYETVATVRVDPFDPSAELTPAEPDMAAEEGLAQSRRVSVAARQLLRRPAVDVEELESGVAVQIVNGSRVLQVRGSATTPETAADRANAVAAAYLATRATDAMAAADRVRRRAEHRLREPGATGRAQLEATITSLELVDLRGGAVIDPARTPRSAAGPGLGASSIAGLTAGLLLAAPVAARPAVSRTRAARAS
ncbi:MAG: hypothetical protein JWP31_986 [Aeromicrobium sp.]|nr:hypothetical protein [Aeromicrobium sp.]